MRKMYGKNIFTPDTRCGFDAESFGAETIKTGVICGDNGCSGELLETEYGKASKVHCNKCDYSEIMEWDAETFEAEDEGVCKLCGVRRAALNEACNPCRVKKGLRPYVFEKGYDDNMYCSSCKNKMKGYGEGHYCEKCDNPKITKMDSESFEALDYELNRDDCCEVWVEKLYDDGKIGFGQAGNLLVGIEKGELKCSQL